MYNAVESRRLIALEEWNKQARVQGNKVTLSFPFDRRIIERVKTIEGRRWESDKGYWSIPFTPWHCDQMVKVLQPIGFVFSPEIVESRNRPKKPPQHQYPDGLYEFQKMGVRFLYAAKGRAILADSMGLGKTITTLAYLRMYAGRTLVVCPASVVYKWADECAKWMPDWKVQVVTKGRYLLEDDADVLIMSYAIMVAKYRDLEMQALDAIVLDEAHYIKSYKSQRHRAAKALIMSKADKAIFLSGTPFLNHPRELFPLLNILDPVGYGNFYTFAKRYLGAQYINGAWYMPDDVVTNRTELSERLQAIMIRRTLKQVELELPDLTRVSLPVEMDSMVEYRRAVKDIRAWLKTKERQVLNPAHVLTKLNVLRQIVGEGKVKHAVELAEGVLNDGRKVVLFAHHRDVVEAIVSALKGYGLKMIVGDIPQKERSLNVKEFLSPDSSCRVMVISTAGAEGIDLYSASDIIFVEREWTPAREEQAEARLHRNGQKNPVTAHYLVAKGTVDEKLDEIVRAKRKVFGQVISQDEVLELVIKGLEG